MKPHVEKQLTQALQEIANEEISENMNLWPEIQARLDTPRPISHSRRMKKWGIALVAVALLGLTAAVYAIRQFGWPQSDAGLDRIKDTNLIQDLNLSQTVNDTTVTLKQG